MKATRLCAILMATLVPLALSVAPSVAAPLVAFPGGTHPPGFVVHLPLSGGPLVPAGPAVGPILYGDPVPSPTEPHHFEFELNNPAAIPASFNLSINILGMPLPLTGISLAPGASVYYDILYPDLPEVAPFGTYSFFATNPDILSPLLTVSASVIEYPFPIGLPGAGPVIVGGGAVLPFPLLGVAPVLITVVPEPATAVLAVIGMTAVVVLGRRRRR